MFLGKKFTKNGIRPTKSGFVQWSGIMIWGMKDWKIGEWKIKKINDHVPVIKQIGSKVATSKIFSSAITAMVLVKSKSPLEWVGYLTN